MSFVIMAYAEHALKEYYLPAINNADYSIYLSKMTFEQPYDIKLTLEIINHKWFFCENPEYVITDNEGNSMFNHALCDGDILYFTNGSIDMTFVVAESEEVFQVFRKYDISKVNEIRIGSLSDNHIQYEMLGYISRNHAVIQFNEGNWILYDISRNGVFSENKRIRNSKVLRFGDCISIFGLRIVFLDNILAVCRSFGSWKTSVNGLVELDFTHSGERVFGKHRQFQKKYFKRAPRNREILFEDEIEIDAPPQIKKAQHKPIFMTIGPAFTMAIPMLMGSLMAIIASQSRGGNSSIYMFTGLITAVASACVGVFWALTNLKYSEETELQEKERRYNSYGTYLLGIANKLKEKYDYNSRVLNQTYCSAEACCTYDENNVNLWNRNFSHNDFLYVRLGIGELPFQAKIITPKQRFAVETDDLMKRPEELKENYKILYQVPIGVDLLEHKLIGIVGGANKTGALDIMYCMVAQIAVNNCYSDVKMAFIYDAKTDEERKVWNFAKWLPHVWSEDRKTRYVAENKNNISDVCYEISKILRHRMEVQDGINQNKMLKPHIVLFVENQELLEGELLAKSILEQKSEYGLTTILLAEHYEELPNVCEQIIQNDGTESSLYNVAESSQQKKKLQFDRITGDKLLKLARRLSHIEINETEIDSEIPSELDFFEMYGVTSMNELNVQERWMKNRTYDSMKALIGKKSGNSDCFLDVHEKYHGPHGLIAGTTGSGKSETLQTYILSLAVNFSPYDVGFFIIDFKGGGMANLFSNLPHLIGQISNLSGNQVRRAMISIKSENKRRQRIFTEHSVNNINLYTRLYKSGEAAIPIPHLFIIIDEFAELKREEPEFMKELISVAQVGRSLGVHLILATQKPSGTVDENIWSNTKFRLCLRVQDRQDSNDMLHKPDAAYITQTGRGYLQVGNDEIYEMFQSGYSGAIYDEDSLGGKVSVATMLTLTGKTAVVGNTNKRKKTEKRRHEWLCVFAQVVDELAAELNTGVSQLLLDNALHERVYSGVIQKLSARGFNYEMSDYNCKRIQDFIELWPIYTAEGTTFDTIVEYIEEEAVKHKRKLPELKDKTQLDAVVEYLTQIADMNGYIQKLTLWLPVLPTLLPLNTLKTFDRQCFNGTGWQRPESRWTLDVPVGLYDDPENQAQEPYCVDFAANGHLAVCGTVATGKSTFLQTLVYALINKYTPEQLNLYLLDFSSHMMAPFEKAAHVGGVVYDSDYEKQRRFFNMLERILEERKKIFQGGNYAQYVRTNGVVFPAVIVVIDNFANFKEKTKGKYDDVIMRLSREGVGYGMYLVLSSAGFGVSEIQSKIGDNIKTVIALDMGDKFKFAEVLRTTRVEVLPEANVKGRGLAYVNGNILEIQIGIAGDSIDDYERAKKIEELCNEMNLAWHGAYARKIPDIPEKPMLDTFMQLEEYKSAVHNHNMLPIGYHVEDASMYGVQLASAYCYMITGKARTGKTNVLKNIIVASSEYGGRVTIIEEEKNELRSFADKCNAKYISSDKELFDFFRETVPIFKSRNLKKRELLELGREDDEIYDSMKTETPFFIFIADMEEFIQAVYRKQADGADMNAYIENITEKGSLHNFYFFACLDAESMPRLVGYKAYGNMTGYKTGIHLGGNLNAQRIFSFNNIPFNEQNKAMKAGVGLASGIDDVNCANKIIIPHAKGV